RGATDLFHQASVLTFYDPDRSQTVTLLGATSTWDAALGELPVKGIASVRKAAAELTAKGGEGLRLLTETVVSPTLHHQIRDFLDAFPKVGRHQYEPINADTAHRAAKIAFDRYVATRYDFTKADVVLSLDADFLTCGPGNLRYVADFMAR